MTLNATSSHTVPNVTPFRPTVACFHITEVFDFSTGHNYGEFEIVEKKNKKA